DQGIGRAADRALHAQRTQQGAGQRGLPGTEVALQVDDGGGRTGLRQRPTQQVGAFGIRKYQFDHARHYGLASTRRCGSRSRGNSPRSPSNAAASPARACSNAPLLAASKPGSPWARSAAITPVSRSPIPPTAMPGLPAAISRATCSGAATTVPAPFSTTTAE